ncbi:hypothetical protein Tco_0769532, partial [Tanacetum coccineum]
FDCSADARSTSFSSLSFVNTEKETHPLWVFTKFHHKSHPWVLTILPNGEALGILANTTKRCEIDLRKDSTVKLTAPSPFPVITFGPFASAIEVLTSLSHAVYVDQTMVGMRRKTVEDEEGQKEKKKSEIMLVNKLEREWQ